MTDMSEMQSEVVPPITLGMRMNAALTYAGMSVEAMAAEMEVSRSSLSRWLNDRGPVKAVVLKQWALRCGVSYDWLRTGAPTTGRCLGDIPGARISSRTDLKRSA